MPTIASIRQQYPQYKDLSDQQLANALHAKFYSDVPQAQFYKKIGFQPVPTPEDMARSFVGHAAASLNNIQRLINPAAIIGQAAQTFAPLAPKAAQGPIRAAGDFLSGDMATRALGGSYAPQTEPGRVAGAVGSFVPNALMPEESIPARIASVVAPGVAQEGARAITQAAGGSPVAQTVAGIGGAVAGGAGASAFSPMSQGRDLAPQILNPAERGAAAAIEHHLALTGDTTSDVVNSGRLPAAATGGLAQLADRTAQQPGMGKIILQKAIGQRFATQNARVLQSAQQHLGVDPATAHGDVDSIVQAGQQAVKPAYDALRSNPAPVWNDRLALLAQTKPIKAAIAKVGENLATDVDGPSPTAMGLQLNPKTGNYIIPQGTSLADATAQRPTAAAWIAAHQMLGRMVDRSPLTNAVLPDSVSNNNSTINKASMLLRNALAGDPATGEGAAIPGYNDVLNQGGDYLSTRSAFNRISGKLFNGLPTYDFGHAWASLKSPAEQAAGKAAIANDILTKTEGQQVLPALFRGAGVQGKLATAFGPGAQPFIDDMSDQLEERQWLGKAVSNSATFGRIADAAAANKPSGFQKALPGLAEGAAKYGAMLTGFPHTLLAMAVTAGLDVAHALKPSQLDPQALLADPDTNIAVAKALESPQAFTGLMAKSALQNSLDAQAKAAVPAGLLNAPAYAAPGISGLLSAGAQMQPQQ